MLNCIYGIKPIFIKSSKLDGEYYDISFEKAEVSLEYLFEENIFPYTDLYHSHFIENVEYDFSEQLFRFLNEKYLLNNVKDINNLSKFPDLRRRHISTYEHSYRNNSMFADVLKITDAINSHYMFTNKKITYDQFITDIKNKIRKDWEDPSKSYVIYLLNRRSFNDIRNFVRSISPKKVLKSRSDVTVENLCKDLSVDDFSDKEETLIDLLFGYHGITLLDKDKIIKEKLNEDGFLKLDGTIDKLHMVYKNIDYFGNVKNKNFHFRPKIINFEKSLIEKLMNIKQEIKKEKSGSICFSLSFDEICKHNRDFAISFPWIFNNIKFFNERQQIKVTNGSYTNQVNRIDLLKESKERNCSCDAYVLRGQTMIGGRRITKNELFIMLNSTKVKYKKSSRKNELIKELTKACICKCNEMESILNNFFSENKFFTTENLNIHKNRLDTFILTDERLIDKEEYSYVFKLDNLVLNKIIEFYVRKHLRGGIVVDPSYINNSSTDEVLMGNVLRSGDFRKIFLKLNTS